MAIIGTNAEGKPTLQFDGEAFVVEEGRIYTENGNGTTTLYQLENGQVVSSTVDQPKHFDETPAMVRLRARKERRGDVIQPLVLHDGDVTEEWFIRKLAHQDHVIIGTYMGQMGFSVVDLSGDEAQKAYLMSVLMVGTCESATSEAPFFASMDEVEAWYSEPGMQSATVALFASILQLNPDIIPPKPQKKIP